MITGPDQYASDANLRARQRLWLHQEPSFDLPGWVVALTGAGPGTRVLDVGCGNGGYLARLRGTGAWTAGCDLSMGMLRSAGSPLLLEADAQWLAVRDDAVEVVVAAHMMYHVPDRARAAAEMRRVLVPGGRCVVVTNGESHIASLRRLVESVVHRSTPGWRMVDWATQAFSLESGIDTLRRAFDDVVLQRPPVRSEVRISEAGVVADYVASVGDAYCSQVAVPWDDVVEATRDAAAAVIERDGVFVTAGATGAFICR